tara:strand:- start:586 stop:1551 length:966 start_codon:yes stop_codon:yes gene_type:complete
MIANPALKLWENYTKDLNLDSFREKNQLHPSFWTDFKLDESIRSHLENLATQFFNNLKIDNVDIEDITMTGSLANLNWSKFSDIDLHILVDFKKIDENIELVGEFFRAKTSIWNKNHKILVKNHEIELYIQDINEPHHSTGVYSIKDSNWVTKPAKKEAKFDKSLVKKKSNSFMDQIDRAYDLYEDKKYSHAHDYSERLMEKIKKFRKSGLEDAGEYSIENITFKVLRRNGYLGLLSDLKGLSYDKMMSIDGKHANKFKIFIKNGSFIKETGFNRLFEIEKFQKRVIAKHKRLKKLNLGYTKGQKMPKEIAKRAKSAPPGG